MGNYAYEHPLKRYEHNDRESILACQLPDRHQSLGKSSGRLCMAILDDAISAVLRIKGINIGNKRGGKACRKDSLRLMRHLQWINSDEKHWPFSFINCCYALNLEPYSIRQRVMEIFNQ